MGWLAGAATAQDPPGVVTVHEVAVMTRQARQLGGDEPAALVMVSVPSASVSVSVSGTLYGPHVVVGVGVEQQHPGFMLRAI